MPHQGERPLYSARRARRPSIPLTTISAPVTDSAFSPSAGDEAEPRMLDDPHRADREERRGREHGANARHVPVIERLDESAVGEERVEAAEREHAELQPVELERIAAGWASGSSRTVAPT